MSAEPQSAAPRRVSKKDQILTLFKAGITDVADLAAITASRTSYVASVLTGNDQLPGYFDLYTSTRRPMNAYSKFFAGKLSYRDEAAARESVALLDHYYRQFAVAGDRAGQHHVLLLALTMFDRARWTGKSAEAAVYRAWLKERLDDDGPAATAVTPARPR
jgi:hypothetical protein